jgi:hypothetical protein
MNPLSSWQNFYVIVGSSAGALIGLQFVVLSLISALPRPATSAEAGTAFATPNIVHFGTVLGLSAILSAPWDSLDAPSILWGSVGLAGIIYSIVTTRRMRSQTAYQPEFEDWLFYSFLPLAAYATLAISACTSRPYPRNALLAVAAAVLLLLFTGIHNAWDAVTYHVFAQRKESSK